MSENGAEPLAAQRIIRNLGDCCLADWQWVEPGRTLTLRFSWISFLGGEGHDVVLYLHGVSHFAFECGEDDRAYYTVFDALLTREITKDDGKTRYRLKTEGEVKLEVVCQTCEIFEQAAFDETNVKTMQAEEATLVDLKKRNVTN